MGDRAGHHLWLKVRGIGWVLFIYYRVYAIIQCQVTWCRYRFIDVTVHQYSLRVFLHTIYGQHIIDIENDQIPNNCPVRPNRACCRTSWLAVTSQRWTRVMHIFIIFLIRLSPCVEDLLITWVVNRNLCIWSLRKISLMSSSNRV